MDTDVHMYQWHEANGDVIRDYLVRGGRGKFA